MRGEVITRANSPAPNRTKYIHCVFLSSPVIKNSRTIIKELFPFMVEAPVVERTTFYFYQAVSLAFGKPHSTNKRRDN